MKFLVCFVALCLAVAQAHVIGSALTYAAAPATYAVPATYAATYNAVPATYAATYNTAPLVRSVAPVASVYSAPAYTTYSAAVPAAATYTAGVAPAVYAAPTVYSTLLKK